MRRDYTNKNKRFYDKEQYTSNKGKKDKKKRFEMELFLYIFNNFDAFENLINCLIETEAEYKKRLKELRSCRVFFLNDCENEEDFKMISYSNFYTNKFNFYSLFKYQESIELFFENCKHSKVETNYFNTKETMNFLEIFLNSPIFNKNIFVDKLLLKFEKNIYLQRHSKHFDFEAMLSFAMENINILEILPSETKMEILELLEFQNEF